jgi:hypothetical protein
MHAELKTDTPSIVESFVRAHLSELDNARIEIYKRNGSVVAELVENNEPAT